MTKVIMNNTRKLNFTNVSGDVLQKNFDFEINHIVRKFNDAKNYNNEAKMNVYNQTEIQLTTYFNLFKGTSMLSEYIDTLSKIYNEIQIFKGKIYPEIYGNYEYQCFENKYYHYTFK